MDGWIGIYLRKILTFLAGCSSDMLPPASPLESSSLKRLPPRSMEKGKKDTWLEGKFKMIEGKIT